MEKCPNKPSAIAAENAKRLEDKERAAKIATEDERIRLEFIESGKCKRSIGDHIYVVDEVITKPKYEERFGRMVKSRYYDEKYYRAFHRTIKSIDIRISRNFKKKPFAYAIYNKKYSEADLYQSKQEAEEAASEKTRSYKESVKEAMNLI
jgi:hypothetical protein